MFVRGGVGGGGAALLDHKSGNPENAIMYKTWFSAIFVNTASRFHSGGNRGAGARKKSHGAIVRERAVTESVLGISEISWSELLN